MKIEEFISIAEEYYGNDNKANEMNSDLWYIKHHETITLEHYCKNPEVKEYNLTEVELLSIIMLQGKGCTLIQVAAFIPSRLNVVSKILIEALDSALLKIPRTNEKVLERCEDNYDYHCKAGEIITINGFFTTSKDYPYDPSKIKFIIKPLDSMSTKAHDIYKVYNHASGIAKPENQVEFERGAKFVVTAIEECDSIRVIHISEVKE